ncbi:cytidylyltransferase domain-containing protein [Streptosporangium sp. CA-135522]|uniref:cytidylyltransferase domain-containing protein n=1 Tax=Streptosporangium sp. CA-135522 TaxID=3240072 RepID=UPI003D8CF21B
MAVHIAGVIQARMGSTRLPGKVLRTLGGRTVLERVVRAASRGGALDDLMVATTIEPADDDVVAECERLGVSWHRGPVDDVLTRFLGALDRLGCDAVMRITADCPLLDPEIVAMAAATWRAMPVLDYLSTSPQPRTLPRGLDVEIVSSEALRALDAVAAGHHRTHVTSYIYTHAERFRIVGLTFPPGDADLRLTLDTPQDWALISAVVDRFGDDPVPSRALIGWLRGRPEVVALNAAVEQKALEEA